MSRRPVYGHFRRRGVLHSPRGGLHMPKPNLWGSSHDGLTWCWRKVGGCLATLPLVAAVCVRSTVAGARLFALDDGTNNNTIEVGHGATSTARLFVTVGGVLQLHIATTSTLGATPAVIGVYVDTGAGVPRIFFNGVDQTTLITSPFVGAGPVTTSMILAGRTSGNIMTGNIYRALVCPAYPGSFADAQALMAALHKAGDWSAFGAPHVWHPYNGARDGASLCGDEGDLGHGWRPEGPGPGGALGLDFVDGGAGNDSIVDLDGADLTASGYRVGGTVTVATANNPANNGTYTILAISTTTTPNDTIQVATASLTADAGDRVAGLTGSPLGWDLANVGAPAKVAGGVWF